MLEKLTLFPDDKILDASAGTGLFAESIIKKYGPFKRLVLNDPSAKMLEQAKYRLRYYEDVEFYDHYSEKLPFEDDSFSQIICLNSFHYYTNQSTVLKHFRRILKPGGNLWMLDWNRTGAFKITNKLIDWFSPENIHSRTLREMKSLFREAGFDVKEKDTWSYRWWNFFFVKCTPV